MDQEHEDYMGRVAYDATVRAVGQVSSLPPWDELPDELRDAAGEFGRALRGLRDELSTRPPEDEELMMDRAHADG